MNKSQLVKQVQSRLEVSKNEAEKAVNTVIEVIQETLQQRENVAIQGFGTFSTHRKEQYTARNPQTGEPIVVPAKYVPKFKPGKRLKEAVK